MKKILGIVLMFALLTYGQVAVQDSCDCDLLEKRKVVALEIQANEAAKTNFLLNGMLWTTTVIGGILAVLIARDLDE